MTETSSTRRPNEPAVRFTELRDKHSESFAWSMNERDLIIDDEDWELDTEDITPEDEAKGIKADLEEFRVLVRELRTSPYYRDTLSAAALSQSVCPIHFTDYAQCFEDEDPECEGVRVAFPSHDT